MTEKHPLNLWRNSRAAFRVLLSPPLPLRRLDPFVFHAGPRVQVAQGAQPGSPGGFRLGEYPRLECGLCRAGGVLGAHLLDCTVSVGRARWGLPASLERGEHEQGG